MPQKSPYLRKGGGESEGFGKKLERTDNGSLLPGKFLRAKDRYSIKMDTY